jgi:REP element-mobilizing transposase RayT
MRVCRLNSHSKYDLKVHLIWMLKYRKQVSGQVAERKEQEGETVDDGRFRICGTVPARVQRDAVRPPAVGYEGLALLQCRQ